MYGDSSNPSRFLYGQSGTDDRNLALKVFGGEVFTAYDLETKFRDLHQMKTVSSGKSWQFPKTWKATSEYHTPGTELLGNDIDTTEITVTIDNTLVAHTAISDIDEMLSHFDVRGPYAEALGKELAKVFDKNVARQIILSARTEDDGPFPGGTVITDSTLKNDGTANGKDWIDHIVEANETLFDLDVPESETRYCAVNKKVFNNIKWATDSNGQYLALRKEFGIQAGGVAGRGEALEIDGVTIFATRNMPSADETSDTSVYSKYRADYSTTTGILWTPMAAATVKMMDIGFESMRDTRRLEDFLLAKMLVGHGSLRPECAVEFKTS